MSRPAQHLLYMTALFGLPVVMVWWLLFRWSPDPPLRGKRLGTGRSM
jgi:hypothetical protein